LWVERCGCGVVAVGAVGSVISVAIDSCFEGGCAEAVDIMKSLVGECRASPFYQDRGSPESFIKAGKSIIATNRQPWIHIHHIGFGIVITLLPTSPITSARDVEEPACSINFGVDVVYALLILWPILAQELSIVGV
jgi:hypothetical protein